jgi:hypothetical protein
MCRSTHSPNINRRGGSNTGALAAQLFIQSKRFDLIVKVCFGRFALLLERREIVPQCGERVFLESEPPERATFELA